MSTRPINFFLGQSDDPRQVELIRSLVEKTRQGRFLGSNKQTRLQQPYTRSSSQFCAGTPLILNRKPELAVADGSGRKRE